MWNDDKFETNIDKDKWKKSWGGEQADDDRLMEENTYLFAPLMMFVDRNMQLETVMKGGYFH